jgi:uncharacterized membrane protein YhiD involved in acid resistance
MPDKVAQAAIDPTTILGVGATGVGTAATFAQYYPLVTGSMAFIVMVMTIVHMYRKIKNSNLDEQIKLQEIELNKRKLRRATDNPMCEPD